MLPLFEVFWLMVMLLIENPPRSLAVDDSVLLPFHSHFHCHSKVHCHP